MFSRKWRLQNEKLKAEVERLQQDKQALQRELEDLRSLQEQTEQEQAVINSVSRYQHDLQGKLVRSVCADTQGSSNIATAGALHVLWQ